MNKSRAIACTGLMLYLVAFTVGQTASAPATDPQQMENWWNDLKENEPKASIALLNFSSKPQQTIAFFKDRVVPLKIAADDVTVLLTALGSDKESVWKPAFEQLEYFDPRLCIDLETLMADVKDAPARTRLVEILSDRLPESLAGKTVELRAFGAERSHNFVIDRGSFWAEDHIDRLLTKKKWVRAVRAIVLLAHIGTPDAMAIVKDMASGHPDALPTKVAKETMELVAK